MSRTRIMSYAALGALILLGAGSAESAVRTTRREAREAMDRADRYRKWVDADEAFIDGDRARALEIYAGLAAATGDSTLLLQRRMQAAAERQDSNPPSRSNRDFARLEARLARTEALLAETTGQPGRDMTSVDARGVGLEQVIERQAAEIAALQERLARRSGAALLRFPSIKQGGDVVFVGDIRDGRANGRGYGVWSTGSAYDGEWRDNKRHGRGMFRWKDGESFEGEYRDDLRTGRGTYVFRTGERWEGEWLDDMRHGDGVLYDAKGKVRVSGRWAKDKLVRED